MELLYTSDLHGSMSHYQHILSMLSERAPDVLILGGDCLPDGDRGYPHRAVTKFIQHDFKGFLQLAHDLCPDISILTIFGNHDWSFSIDQFAQLQEQSLLRMLSHRDIVAVDHLRFLGLSHCPPAPYWIKDFERRDLTKDTPTEFGGYTYSVRMNGIVSVTGRQFFTQHESLEEMLDKTPVCSGPFILVSHAPPADSNLDLLMEGKHVGSHAVRNFLERRQPILSLHGHLHESPIVSGHISHRFEKCLAVNPGQSLDQLCAIRWHSDTPDEIEHSLNWKL